MIFSKFTELGSHSHNLVLEYLHYTKKKPCVPLRVVLAPALNLMQPFICFVSIEFCIFFLRFLKVTTFTHKESLYWTCECLRDRPAMYSSVPQCTEWHIVSTQEIFVFQMVCFTINISLKQRRITYIIGFS